MKAGRLRHRCPDVARVRDVLHQLLGEAGADVGVLHVHHRRFSRDRQRLFDAGEGHLGVDGDGRGQTDSDLLTANRLKPGKLEHQRVDARGKRREPVAAIGPGYGDLRLDESRTRDGDGYTGENSSRVVRHRSVDAAAKLLGTGGACGNRQSDEQASQKPAGPLHNTDPSCGSEYCLRLSNCHASIFQRVCRPSRRINLYFVLGCKCERGPCIQSSSTGSDRESIELDYFVRNRIIALALSSRTTSPMRSAESSRPR